MKKILIAAGGTGGHLFPALAVVEKLQQLDENIQFYFFGRKDKIEYRLTSNYGQFIETNLTGFNIKPNFNTIALPFRILRDRAKLSKIIRNENISAVLCAGAYLSVPAGLAAKKCNVPLFLMESNYNLGKAIKFLIPKCSLLFTSFDATTKSFENNPKIAEYIKDKIRNYGNPIRESIIKQIDKEQAAKVFGIDANKQTILIFGGSLGAKTINDAVINALAEFSKLDINIIWQTGNDLNIQLPQNIKLIKFIDNMAAAYSIADLVICRSGATSIAELCICGKPSILVPLSSASNNEQLLNAKYLEKNDAAIIINNGEIGEKLYETIEQILYSGDKLNKMSQASKKLGRPDASEKIANEIYKFKK